MNIKKMISTLALSLFCFTSAQAHQYLKGQLPNTLGGQLFTIAAVYSLALDNGALPVFPDLPAQSNYEELFSHLNVNFPNDQEFSSAYVDSSWKYTPIIFQPNLVIAGRFTSEKYFAHHKQEILDLFAPCAEISNTLAEKYPDILADTNTIAIHIRTLSKKDPRRKERATIKRDYYREAISHFPKDSTFVVFSDSLSKAKKMLKRIPGRFIYIQKETKAHQFYLMSLCRHQIISNSSFSWWAAYLNENPDKQVITPNWFRHCFQENATDLIPADWIVL